MNAKNNVLIMGTIYVTLGSFIGSIFSYGLQIILGRFLSVADYGVFNALLSLSILLAIPAGALSGSIVKLVSELKGLNRFDTLTLLYKQVTVLSLLVGFVLSCVVLLFRFPLAAYLNIQDINVFYYFAAFMLFNFIVLAPNTYLQGLLRFKAFGFFSSLMGFIRLGVPFIFIWFSLGVGGAYLGIAVAMLIMFFVGTFLLKKNFAKYDYAEIDVSVHYKRIFQIGVAMLFISFGMNLLNNVDVILVKHFFDAETAGLYSGVVTIGKVFLFGAGTITMVMYPQISELYARKEEFFSKFKLFFGLQIMLIFGGLFAFSLFPNFIVRVMFGERFLPAAEYIPLFSIFVAAYILVNFMLLFFVAINRTRVYAFLLPAVGAQYVLIKFFFNTSLYDVIYINIGVSLFLVVTLFIYSVYTLRDIHKTSKI